MHDYFAIDMVKDYEFEKIHLTVDEFCFVYRILICSIGDRLNIADGKQ